MITANNVARGLDPRAYRHRAKPAHDETKGIITRRALLGAALAVTATPAEASRTERADPGYVAASRYFTTSDGVSLHYVDAFPSDGGGLDHVLVLVPGWTMPAWIFGPQITYFARYCRVIAFDPRGQGASEVPPFGYTAQRRGQDIAELISAIRAPKVVLLGWSLGVLDSLAYVSNDGAARLSALVLIDNSIGENPPPRSEPAPRHHGYRRPMTYPEEMGVFVRAMFRAPQPQSYLTRLTQTCLITPESAAHALLNYQVPRTVWRDAVYSAGVPILYCVRPHLEGQAENLARRDTQAEIVIFRSAGHALFVDDAPRFNTVLANFLRERVWS